MTWVHRPRPRREEHPAPEARLEPPLSADELRELGEAEQRAHRVEARLGGLPERWDDMLTALGELKQFDEEEFKAAGGTKSEPRHQQRQRPQRRPQKG